MKRVYLLIILTAICAGSLLAEEAANPFRDYRKNPTRETFLNAYNVFMDNLKADEADLGSRLMLTYVLLMEMNRTAEYFDLNPDSLDQQTQFGYANLLFEIGQYEKAIPIYQSLNDNVPTWSCPWRHKGTAQYHIGDYGEAEISLKKAVETRETHYDAYIWLAKSQAKLGKYKEALQTFDKGVSVKGMESENPEEEIPPADEAFLHLELLDKNGKNKEFQELRETLKKTYPDNPYWKQAE